MVLHARRLARVALVSVTSLGVGLAVASALTAAWISARASVAAPGPASSAELLTLAAASLALLIAAWLLVGTTLEVLCLVPGRVGRAAQVWADRLSPALARRIAAFVLGVGVGVAGGPSQAVASSSGPVVTSSVAEPGFVATRSASGITVTDPGFAPTSRPILETSETPASAPEPGFTPDPQAAPAPAAPAPGFTPRAPRVRPQPDPGLLGARASATTDDAVVVHRGDTLWAIAARQLGPTASDAEIARAWPQWFTLNRDLIGDDPDLLLPGQILRVPDAQQTASVTR